MTQRLNQTHAGGFAAQSRGSGGGPRWILGAIVILAILGGVFFYSQSSPESGTSPVQPYEALINEAADNPAHLQGDTTERIQELEAENQRLRQELDDLRAGSSADDSLQKENQRLRNERDFLEQKLAEMATELDRYKRGLQAAVDELNKNQPRNRP